MPWPPPALAAVPLAGDLVDRAAHLRTDDDALAAAWAAGADVVVVGPGGVVRDDAGRVLRAASPGASMPPLLLGIVQSRPVFIEQVDAADDRAGAVATLRALTGGTDPVEAQVMAIAMGLTQYHRRHPHCPRCGAATVLAEAGWSRWCEACSTTHHPRTDPAVIVLVVDDDDRALLGRQAAWPEGRFSTLAGFVEPGESAEAAVRREVLEESAIAVTDVAYRGSQPWPFPGSLMLGFTARAEAGAPVPDGVEMAEVGWFSRAELAEGIEAGVLAVPPGLSISRALIADWFGDDLPASSWTPPRPDR